jgi:hypothetical protein
VVETVIHGIGHQVLEQILVLSAEQVAGARTPGKASGDMINKGEPVFVIPHPNNQHKKVVFQSNRLIECGDEYLAYEADTDFGSSGSPVYNRQWEVVALHHATQMARHDQGRILARDGGLWDPSMGSKKSNTWI